MNNLAEQQPCTLCQSTRGLLIETKDRHGGPLEVMMCGGCGFVHNHPVPTQEDLSNFYSHHYRKVYKKVLLPKLKHAVRYFPGATTHILSHRDLFRNTRSVLDAGCGSGEFLYLMAGLDKKVTGIEPNLGYSEFCRHQLGLPVVTGEICSFEPPAQFDHIRLNHVLEHLRNPLECLTLLRGWLTENGHILPPRAGLRQCLPFQITRRHLPLRTHLQLRSAQLRSNHRAGRLEGHPPPQQHRGVPVTRYRRPTAGTPHPRRHPRPRRHVCKASREQPRVAAHSAQALAENVPRDPRTAHLPQRKQPSIAGGQICDQPA
ncbi:MAG: class I SAM-dependent methyltransferase [Verrucomicrobia bacterium]|nr:class I SAM-dependent methyltransferase [Verrucomicrobiota bacterium]